MIKTGGGCCDCGDLAGIFPPSLYSNIHVILLFFFVLSMEKGRLLPSPPRPSAKSR